MIKIINGIYGYKQGNSIIPKTKKDEPFECDKAEEARLVQLGVAVYVTEKVEEVEEAVEITKEDLIAQFKALGLKGNPKSMKAETLIAKIKEANAKEVSEEVEEDIPTFDEVDGVAE